MKTIYVVIVVLLLLPIVVWATEEKVISTSPLAIILLHPNITLEESIWENLTREVSFSYDLKGGWGTMRAGLRRYFSSTAPLGTFCGVSIWRIVIEEGPSFSKKEKWEKDLFGGIWIGKKWGKGERKNWSIEFSLGEEEISLAGTTSPCFLYSTLL